MQQEAEPKPRYKVYEIPIRDRVMKVTIDTFALAEATMLFLHGPCEIEMDETTFQSRYWERTPFETIPFSRYYNRLRYILMKKLNLPEKIVESPAFFYYRDL